MLHGAAWAARRDRASALVEDPQQRHLPDWREQRTRRRAELAEKTARRQAEFTALLPAIAAQVAADVSAAVAAALQATRAEPLKELDLAPTTATTSIISERAAATPSPTSAPASIDDLSPELDATTELTAPTPTDCLSKCQSHDASVSLSRLLSTTAPASSTTKGDVLPVFAAPMVGDKALEVDNTGDTSPTAAFCLLGSPDHSIGGEDPRDMSLTPWSAPPFYNGSPDWTNPLSAPMHILELFKLSPSTCSTDCSGSIQRHDLMSTLNKELKVIAEPIETGGMLTEAYQLFNEVPTVTEIVTWPPPSWPCARPPLIRGHDLFQHAQQRHGQEFSVTDSKWNWNAIWLRVELKPPWFFSRCVHESANGKHAEADALLLLISGLHVPCLHFCVAQGYPRSDGLLDILNGEAVLQQSYSTSASCTLSPFIQRGNTHFTKLMQWTFSHSLLQSEFRFYTRGHIFFFCCALEQWKILWMISLVSLKSCFLCCRDGCESLYSCKNFQWIIAWSLSNHSSLSSHQSGPIGVTSSPTTVSVTSIGPAVVDRLEDGNDLQSEVCNGVMGVLLLAAAHETNHVLTRVEATSATVFAWRPWSFPCSPNVTVQRLQYVCLEPFQKWHLHDRAIFTGMSSFLQSVPGNTKLHLPCDPADPCSGQRSWSNPIELEMHGLFIPACGSATLQGSLFVAASSKNCGICPDLGCAMPHSICWLPWDPGEKIKMLGYAKIQKYCHCPIQVFCSSQNVLGKCSCKGIYVKLLRYQFDCAGYPQVPLEYFLVGSICDVWINFHSLYPEASACWSLTANSVPYHYGHITVGLVFPYGSVSLPWENAWSSLCDIWMANWNSCELGSYILWSQTAVLLLAYGTSLFQEPMEQWDPGIAMVFNICTLYCYGVQVESSVLDRNGLSLLEYLLQSCDAGYVCLDGSASFSCEVFSIGNRKLVAVSFDDVDLLSKVLDVKLLLNLARHSTPGDTFSECFLYLVSVILLSEELQLSWYRGSCHYRALVCLHVAEFSCLTRLFLWEIAWPCCVDGYRLFLWEIAWPMVLEYSHIDKKSRHLISPATFQSFTQAKATSRIKVEAPNTLLCPLPRPCFLLGQGLPRLRHRLDLVEVRKLQVPWDPGGSRGHRLEDKPEFKEGGMLATILPGGGPSLLGQARSETRRGRDRYIRAEHLRKKVAWNGWLRPPLLGFLLLPLAPPSSRCIARPEINMNLRTVEMLPLLRKDKVQCFYNIQGGFIIDGVEYDSTPEKVGIRKGDVVEIVDANCGSTLPELETYLLKHGLRFLPKGKGLSSTQGLELKIRVHDLVKGSSTYARLSIPVVFEVALP